MKQFMITPASGKRLIGKAVAAHPAVLNALQHGTIVIVAGTTNGYAVEEIFARTGQPACNPPVADSIAGREFSRAKFFRGVTLPASRPTTKTGRLPDESGFPGDVVIVKGIWQKGKTIFDIVDDLQEGDVILKGANALDLVHRRAAILIGHPKAGTIGAALQAVMGRRVRLILPVGLEKRIAGDLDILAEKLNQAGANGARLFPVPGEVLTEIDAINLLTGATAELFAAGGVGGAEGGVWLAVSGNPEQMKAAEDLLKSAAREPGFEL